MQKDPWQLALQENEEIVNNINRLKSMQKIRVMLTIYVYRSLDKFITPTTILTTLLKTRAEFFLVGPLNK